MTTELLWWKLSAISRKSENYWADSLGRNGIILGMAEYASKDDVQEIVDKAVTDLSEIIAHFGQQIDTRFNEVEARQRELDRKFDRLLNTIDTFIGRIDRYETEQLARDNQFDRLLEWARKVSEKTGIPLEKL